MHYDPEKDRSEDFGWKKAKDEYRPSEEEQRRWAWYSLLVSIKLTAVALILGA